MLTGQIIGRLGNFVNQEAFGIPITDPRLQTFPFAVWIDDPQGVEPEYHDLVFSKVPGWFAATFFYEMVWNFIGAVIFYAIWRKNKRFPGILGFCYFFWYFLGRAWLESLRIDAVPVTQVACIIIVPVALSSFRTVNAAVIAGELDVTELSRFDVANYKFVTRLLAKGGRFPRWFYGAEDIPVAELAEGDYIKKVKTSWKLPAHCRKKARGAAAKEKK